MTETRLQVRPHPIDESEEKSIADYWRILVKYRKSIAATFVIVTAVGTYCALTATRVYTATATIKIEPQNPRVTGVGEIQPFIPRNQLGNELDYHQTQMTLIRSRALAARMINELGLERNKSFLTAQIVTPNPAQRVRSWGSRLISHITPLFRSSSAKQDDDSGIPSQLSPSRKPAPELTVSPALIRQYLEFINVSSVKETLLVDVQFTTPAPSLSQALANAHVEGFMRMSLENRFTLTQEAREFLGQKKDELLQKLSKAEAELNNFRRAHGVFSVEKGENIVVDRLLEINKQLTAARAQRLEAESLQRTVENRSYQNLAEIMRQPLVQQLKTNLASLEAEKVKLETIFQPAHPRVQDLNEQISAARRALNSEITSVVQSIRSNYAAALAKERALQSEADGQQRDALKLRELGVQYTILQEEVTAHRALYESLTKRLNETNVSNDLAVSNMQMIEWAAKPMAASGPNLPLYLVASIASGLFLGICGAFLREFFNSTAETADEVRRSIGLTTLGVVPYTPSLDSPHFQQIRRDSAQNGMAEPLAPKTFRTELIASQSPLSIMNESYRMLRTSLLLAQEERPPQVIVITSPSPGDGKTITILNLSIALAQDGHKVLLVDADMRKGCCHTRLGLINHRGLSNVLTGRLALDDGIQGTSIPGLSLLSCGAPTKNAAELLGSMAMRDLLVHLRRQFEFILVDSPPAMAISDAAILSRLADGVLLVLHGQKTSLAEAKRTVDRLQLVHAPLLGVILNAVDLDHPDYSYYREYSRYYPDSNERESGLGAAQEESAGSTSDGKEPVPGHIHVDGADWTLSARNPQPPPVQVRDPIFAPPRLIDARNEDGSNGTVSKEFLRMLSEVFNEAIGPIGTLVLHEKISSLGESSEAFPLWRIDELIRAMDEEIVLPESKEHFHERVSRIQVPDMRQNSLF